MADNKTLATARELIEFAAPMAAQMFEKIGELRPLWHIVSADGEHGIIAAPMGDGFQKDIVDAAMRELFQELDAVAVVYMCEAWIRVGGPELDEQVGLENDPLRQECLWFSAEDAEGSIIAYQMIDRPNGPGGPGWLQPLKWLNKQSRMEGRFVGMLPTKGKGH